MKKIAKKYFAEEIYKYKKELKEEISEDFKIEKLEIELREAKKQEKIHKLIEDNHKLNELLDKYTDKKDGKSKGKEQDFKEEYEVNKADSKENTSYMEYLKGQIDGLKNYPSNLID